MAQANRNNACECHLQAARAEIQVLAQQRGNFKHQSGKVKQSQGELSVTNELKYACRPQDEQTGKTQHRISPDKQAQAPQRLYTPCTKPKRTQALFSPS